MCSGLGAGAAVRGDSASRGMRWLSSTVGGGGGAEPSKSVRLAALAPPPRCAPLTAGLATVPAEEGDAPAHKLAVSPGVDGAFAVQEVVTGTDTGTGCGQPTAVPWATRGSARVVLRLRGLLSTRSGLTWAA